MSNDSTPTTNPTNPIDDIAINTTEAMQAQAKQNPEPDLSSSENVSGTGLSNDDLKKISAPNSNEFPDIQTEPLINFERDRMTGNIKTRDDGTPIRKNGNPRKLRKGMMMVNGEYFKVESTVGTQTPRPTPPTPQSFSTVDDSDNPQTANVNGDGEPPPPTSNTQDLGRVVSETAINYIAGDDKAKKPTEAEKNLIVENASAMFSGWRVIPAVAFVIGIIAFLMRLKMNEKKKEKKNDATPETNKPSAFNRDNTKREESGGQSDLEKMLGSWNRSAGT